MIEKYRSTFIAGGVSGILLFAGFLMVLFAGYNPVGEASIMYYWIPIPILLRSLRKFRNDIYPEGLPYLAGLKQGGIITLIYACIYAILLYIFCATLEPAFVETWLEQKIEMLNQVSENGTFMSYSIEEVITDWRQNKFFSLSFDEFWYKFIFGAIVTLIASFVFRKPKIVIGS
jgi:hypothetical protein